MTIRSALGKLERDAVRLPTVQPPATPSPWLDAFLAAYRSLPPEQRDWVRYAVGGFTNPEPHVICPEHEAHLWPASHPFPPWGYATRPPIPSWLPDLLRRLGLPPDTELEGMAAAGELTPKDDDNAPHVVHHTGPHVGSLSNIAG